MYVCMYVCMYQYGPPVGIAHLHFHLGRVQVAHDGPQQRAELSVRQPNTQYTHTHTYTHTYIHIHTYTYTYIHTYIHGPNFTYRMRRSIDCRRDSCAELGFLLSA